MKLVRILVLVFFMIAVVLHGGYTIHEKFVEDNTSPVITADSDEIFVSVGVTDEELLHGMHAEDAHDGDVTDTMVVVSRLDFIQKGTLKVNYAAFDSSNNVATYTRKVTYTDYRSPRFSATTPFRFSETEESATVLSNVTCEDVLDGDLTADIRMTYGSNEGIKYPVVMEVTNSAGDSALVSVNVYLEDRISLSIPSVALDEYIVYTKPGQRINPEAHAIGIFQNGKVSSFTDRSAYTMDNVVWDTSKVDYEKPGEYVITYGLIDDQGETLNNTELYLIVEED